MRLWTVIGIFIEKKGSDEGDSSTEIACDRPEDQTDLLVLSEDTHLAE